MDIFLQVATNWVLPVIFFLAVFSFCTMIFVEMLDSILRWKAGLLARTINNILGVELGEKFWKNILANPLGEKRSPSYISVKTFASIVMHWLVLDFKIPLKKPDAMPIESGDLSKGMKMAIEPLTGKSPILAALITYLIEQAEVQSIPFEQYYQHLEMGIENWFGGALNQVSVSYKRLAQMALVSVGVLVAALANFDVIEMVSRLWKTALLKELVDIYQKTGKPLEGLDTSLFTTLPLGWHQGDFTILANPALLVVKIIGILLGAFLIFICSQYIYTYVKRKSGVQTSS